MEKEPIIEEHDQSSINYLKRLSCYNSFQDIKNFEKEQNNLNNATNRKSVKFYMNNSGANVNIKERMMDNNNSAAEHESIHPHIRGKLLIKVFY